MTCVRHSWHGATFLRVRRLTASATKHAERKRPGCRQLGARPGYAPSPFILLWEKLHAQIALTFARRFPAFTIVELLIVIVIIAILAAVTIVAYNGIQQRANNARTIETARQVIGLVRSYRTVYDAFPIASGACATLDVVCTNSSGVLLSSPTDNNALLTALQKVGTPPSGALPATTDGNQGIAYYYGSGATIDGQAYPLRINYYLQGKNQRCELGNLSNASLSGWSTTGYSSSNGTNTTVCWVLVAS